MGKALLTVIVVGLVAAYMYRDQIAGGWLDFEPGGPPALFSSVSNFGSAMGGFGKRVGDNFR